MRDPVAIVITGGSSGIGAELARGYAAPGILLAITGRDPDRLEEVASECRRKGAEVITGLINVADAGAMQDWLVGIESLRPIDLVIANAGISAGTGKGGVESAAQIDRIFSVNWQGVLNTVLPVIPLMQQRGRGQIALMSSLAGYRGMAGASAYSASKAAVRVYGEALRVELGDFGVGVSVICPGFVKSRMTAVNRFPMPFLWETGQAGAVIRRGLAANKALIAFPWPMRAALWLVTALPAGLVSRLMARAPRKG